MGNRVHQIRILILLGVAATALGHATLFAADQRPIQTSVDIGWDNHFRAGRWNPIFVTVVAREAREVTLEIYSPTDQRYAMKIQQTFAAGPSPRTLPLYMPMINSLDISSITVRDANTGRTLDSFTLDDPAAPLRQRPEMVNSGELMIGSSGNEGTARLLASQLQQSNVVVGEMALPYLPSVSAGYDALDLLILNAPNLNQLDADQQTAILQWVRAGGTLIYWPGNDPLPSSGPLVDALPCKLGGTKTYAIPVPVLRNLGLPARFKQLLGREVTAVADDATKRQSFPESDLLNYRHRVGFGQVIAFPADVAMLNFNDQAKARAFWNAALKGAAQLPDENAANSYNPWNGDPRQARATRQALDWLGDVPGAGAFGFSYLAVALIAMMFVVGPVDWFVLKRLGRQPWTWVTTSGWIALVTFGAISVGHVLKSGDLHFRTVSLIDEADGQRAAETLFAGIYSPRTNEYDLKVDPQSWWKPAGSTGFYRGSGLQIDIPCHQDYRGNRPLPMLINVWNLRFMQSTNLTPATGFVEAHLTRHADLLDGSITSHAPFAMSNVTIRTNDGLLRLDGRIEPGKSVAVSGAINRNDHSFVRERAKNEGYEPELPNTRPTVPTGGDLAPQRSDRIEQFVQAGPDVACIYAEFDAAPQDVKLDAPDVHEQHTGMLRALVGIEK